MPNELTRADSLREYYTGAGSDGGSQTDPDASLGNFRSSTECPGLGAVITSAITGVTLEYSSGGNTVGAGTLEAVDANNLRWTPNGESTPGASVSFSGTETKIVEANSDPGAYLRIDGTTPFSGGPSTITLSSIPNDHFGFPNVSVADASAGSNKYRASILRNEASGSVTSIKRWIGELGTSQVPSAGLSLPSSGAGTITTSGTFADWPEFGYCHVKTSGGSAREIVYYTQRTNTVLTVPAAGRGMLGTTPAAGVDSDTLHAVPGIALALDPDGVEAHGSSIQTIADEDTAPSGVTWNLGITSGTGLNIGTLAVSEQVGLWMWREIPAGAVASPKMDMLLRSSYDAS